MITAAITVDDNCRRGIMVKADPEVNPRDKLLCEGSDIAGVGKKLWERRTRQ